MSKTRNDHIESDSSCSEEDNDESYIINGSRLTNSTTQKSSTINSVEHNNDNQMIDGTLPNMPIEEFMKIPPERLHLLFPDQTESKPFFKDISIFPPNFIEPTISIDFETSEIIVNAENENINDRDHTHLANSNKLSDNRTRLRKGFLPFSHTKFTTFSANQSIRKSNEQSNKEKDEIPKNNNDSVKEPPIHNKQKLSYQKGSLQFDKNRHMHFYGVSMDTLPELPSSSSSESEHEIRDKDGNLVGISLGLSGNKK